MEAIVAIFVFLVFVFISFLIMLIPSFLLIWAYDYVAVQFDWHVLALSWGNVICVAILMAIARSIFKKN